jgi:N-acetylglucosaminyldiphosphoundecaprenol N-acetyl-beta-D-mannosaminyltransferase
VNARAEVLGCPIDRLDMRETLDRCQMAIESGSFAQHMAINAAKVVAMQDDPELRAIVRRCELITADGQSVVWASRLLGDPVRTRVTGIDLMQELISRAECQGWRVFILGARADVLETAVARLRERHPRLVLAGYRDGYFGEEDDEDVAKEIARTRPDILLVAISSPRKEYFLGRHGRALGTPFVMGVGGAVDIMAGHARRAPRWMQVLGLEWLFRLVQEPRRLLRRYAVTNARFVWLVVRSRLAREPDRA